MPPEADPAPHCLGNRVAYAMPPHNPAHTVFGNAHALLAPRAVRGGSPSLQRPRAVMPRSRVFAGRTMVKRVQLTAGRAATMQLKCSSGIIEY
jgi:hypothetical protein